jgi:serine/threonine protein kinase
MAATDKSDVVGERFAEVLAAYLEAAGAGWAPDRRAFLACYPDLAPELEVFFQNEEKLAHLASSLPHPRAAVRWAQGSGPADETAPTAPYAAAPADSPPEGLGAFDDYELLEQIGKGGMGVVYRARQKSLDRLVALKMIRSGEFASRAEVSRFLNEARHAALLDHPHIVPVYSRGEWDGQPFFTMKLVEGGSVVNHLPRLSKDLKAAVGLLAAAARAVHHAHQRGILHRDLKPSNILLDGDGRPMVSDFGLSKRLEDGGPAPPDGGGDTSSYRAPEQLGAGPEAIRTVSEGVAGASSGVVGTPSYMPPEQAGGRRALTTAADVYSLGAILYTFLTGRPPFRGGSPEETLIQVCGQPPKPPRELNPRADRDLEAVCLKCLQKKPGSRYGSAEALAEDLERWLRGEPVRARRQPLLRRGWWAVRRHLLLTSALALCVCAAVAAGVVQYLSDPERPVRALERRIEAGESVPLLGETGGPAWSRWIPSEDTVNISQAADGPFSFSTLGEARVKLLNAVRRPRYRLAAEVRHESASTRGMAGIFLGYTVRYNGEEAKYCWLDLSFADRGLHARAFLGPKQKPGEVPCFSSVSLSLELRTTPVQPVAVSRETPFHHLFVPAEGAEQAAGTKR